MEIIAAYGTAMIILAVVFLKRSDSHPNVAGILGVVFVSFVMIFVAIVFSLFFKFTNDFVIPIMYLGASSCSEAWRRFLQILLSNCERNRIIQVWAKWVIDTNFNKLISL